MEYNQPGEAVYISVIAPCHNEQECIVEFHRRMRRVLEAIERPYELIFVNDGSSDQTAEHLAEIRRTDQNVVIVDLSRNHGHQLALSAGLAVAQGQRVLLIDSDLQDPPELLPEMMAAMDAGADVAYARRISRAGESGFKRMTAVLFYRFLRQLSKTDVPIDTGDFRLISKRVADVLRQMPEPHRFLRGMVTWVGFRQVAVDYNRDSRFAGKTKYSVGGMVGLAMDAITGFACASPLPVLFRRRGGRCCGRPSWLDSLCTSVSPCGSPVGYPPLRSTYVFGDQPVCPRTDWGVCWTLLHPGKGQASVHNPFCVTRQKRCGSQARLLRRRKAQ